MRPLANRIINKIEAHMERERLISMPQVIDVVLTKACNLACTFCRDYETPGGKRVSIENLERMAAELFPTANYLSICSGGEPYLHKGLEHLLRLAKRHQMFTWVLSNGMLFQENRIRAILQDNLISLHGYSVDGYENKTVESIRINAKLEEIVAHIQRLIQMRDEMGRREPRIVIRYALMRCNIEELPAAIHRWGTMGIDRLDCGYLALANGIDRNESLYFHQALTAKVFDQARAAAAKYPALKVNLPGLIVEEQAKKAKPTPCKTPWRFVMIDTSGAILPCYRAFEAVEMGRIYDEAATPFRQIWNGPEYQALRRTVNKDGDKHYKYCSRCEFRYGWGDLAPHLGDDTWIEALHEQKGDFVQIDHRRKNPKSTKLAAPTLTLDEKDDSQN